MSDFTVPDMIDPIVAWRCWDIEGPYLSSLNGTCWVPRERLEATCQHASPKTVQIPGWWLVNKGKSRTWYRDAEGEELESFEMGEFIYSNRPLSYTSSAFTVASFSHGSNLHIEKKKEAKIGINLPPGLELEKGYREEIYVPEHGTSPLVSCQCGIYALEKKSHSSDYMMRSILIHRHQLIFGEVFLWGKVIPGSKGYRAQYAYPKAFHDVQHSQTEFLMQYGVPVFTQKEKKVKRFIFF